MEFIIGTRKEPAAGSSSTAAPTRESAHHAKPPKVLHGTGAEYHLLETLGRGSYAKVKRCTVPATGQVYAIKVFKKAVLKRQRVMSVEADSTVPEFMSKYDTNGDGILSEDEVAHIVADMHESRNSIHASPSAEPQRAPAQKRAAGPSEGPSASAKPATKPPTPPRPPMMFAMPLSKSLAKPSPGEQPSSASAAAAVGFAGPGSAVAMAPPTQHHTAFDDVLREIAILTQLDHPHLMTLHDVIDCARTDKLYLVMDYCPAGAILCSEALPCAPLARADCRRILDGVVAGLTCAAAHPGRIGGACTRAHTHGRYLHEHDVIHADLKPDNILRLPDGGAVITDFGVARVLHSTSHRTVGSFGTPAYTAPEVWGEGRYEGTLADIWSLGVTLHAIVFGCLPFSASGEMELIEQARAPSGAPPTAPPRPTRTLPRRSRPRPSGSARRSVTTPTCLPCSTRCCGRHPPSAARCSAWRSTSGWAPRTESWSERQNPFSPWSVRCGCVRARCRAQCVIRCRERRQGELGGRHALNFTLNSLRRHQSSSE